MSQQATGRCVEFSDHSSVRGYNNVQGSQEATKQKIKTSSFFFFFSLKKYAYSIQWIIIDYLLVRTTNNKKKKVEFNNIKY